MIRLILAIFTTTLIFGVFLVSKVSFADDISLPPIPKDALGVLLITDIRTGRLMALKGMKGEGHYLTRNEQGELCTVAPVSFRAGSINNNGHATEAAEEVIVAVYSRALSEQLTAQQKIVSSDYRIALNPTQDADMVLSKGIGQEEVFVLNPRPIWRSWINTGDRQLTCKPVI